MNEVKRCDEMQRILNHISDEIEKEGIHVKDEEENDDGHGQDKNDIKMRESTKKKSEEEPKEGEEKPGSVNGSTIPHHKEMSVIESSLTKLEYDLIEEIKTFEQLQKTYNELIDHRQVLQKNKEFFELVS